MIQLIQLGTQHTYLNSCHNGGVFQFTLNDLLLIDNWPNIVIATGHVMETGQDILTNVDVMC